ncbi:MAG: hypothetical protein HYU80_03620 [Candidatus Blackburnbacteria bacterium]|nr:hypothetical protein [Candidatus Blackburnbacteria bacterium]
MVENPWTPDRFTASYRTVLVCARVEAQRLNHSEIGTEHILMALLRQPSIHAVFDELCVNPYAVYSVLQEIYKPGKIGSLLPSPNRRASQAVRLAITEANTINRLEVEPTDLLIGVLRVPGQVHVPARILRDHGVTLEKVCFAVQALKNSPQLSQASEDLTKTWGKEMVEVARRLRAILNNLSIYEGAKETLLRYIDKDLQNIEKNAPPAPPTTS